MFDMDMLGFILQTVPAVLAMAALLLLVQWMTPPGRWLARWVPATGGRLEAVDGLRGFLALGVVLCHIATFQFTADGQPWGPHPNPYFRQAGAAAVRMFFMITGFLFWTKALRKGGHLPAWGLYVNRGWRIMPLYLALVMGLVAWSLLASGGRLRVAPGQAGLELLSLLVPGFFPDVVVNGFDTTHVLRQSWTLRWEWLFYLSLPLLAQGLRSVGRAALVLSLLLGVLVFSHELRWINLAADWSVFATFGIGMLAAWLVQRRPDWPFARSAPAHALAVCLVVATPLIIHGGLAIVGNLLYGALFVLIVYGNSVCGLLRWRASRLLGEVSYSIYLLHMVVLVAWMAGLERAGALPEPDYMRYWLLMGPSLFGVAALALFSFTAIEQPGIARSRRVG